MNAKTTPHEPLAFVGWMLWNIVHHELRHVDRPAGIFEDQPTEIRAAWERAATELQRRAKLLGRLA